jgi:O-antigen/teichoic acid export membrane protein
MPGLAPYSQPVSATGPVPSETDVLSGPDVAARVLRGGVQRVGGFILLNVVGAFGAVLLLRHLGVDDYGRYGTVTALLTIVYGVSDAGLTLTGSRELATRRTESERRELLAHLIGLRIIVSAIGVTLAIAFAWAVGYSRTMVEGTAVAGAGIFVLSVQGAILQPLSVELQNWRLTVNDVLRQGLLVACYVALVIAGAKLLPFFAAQLVAALLALLATPLLVGRRHRVRPRWTRSQIRALAARTLPLAVSTVLIAMYFRVLVILMSLLEPSANQVGYYVTSERIIEICLNLPTTLIAVILPVVSVSARDDAGRLRYVTLRMTQMMTLIGVLLAVILDTGARPIMLALGGHQYLRAAPVLQIQCFALITVFVTGAWMTTLVGMHRTRALAVSAAVGVGSVLIFGVALIPPYGAKGGAIAAVGADVVFCGAVYLSLRRSGAAQSLRVEPFVRIALCVLPAFALQAVSPFSALITCILATAAYLACTVLFRALPPEVSSRVGRLLRVPRSGGRPQA